MKRDEIEKEIEKVQKQLQELKEKLNAKNLSDPAAQKKINAAAMTYRVALADAGMNDISLGFGEVAAVGKYRGRGIFLTNKFADRNWQWYVLTDQTTNSEVLVRVDKAYRNIID